MHANDDNDDGTESTPTVYPNHSYSSSHHPVWASHAHAMHRHVHPKHISHAIRHFFHSHGAQEESIALAVKQAVEEFQQMHAGETVSFDSPVEGEAVVTSGFGGRHRPTAHASRNHKGIDIGVFHRAAHHAHDILAAAEGIVEFAGRQSGFGNLVKIGHADGTTTLYGHLMNGPLPLPGTQVLQGQVIGEMGRTGISTGQHVHFEVRDANNMSIQPEIGGQEARKKDLLFGYETQGLRFAVQDRHEIEAPSGMPHRPRSPHSSIG